MEYHAPPCSSLLSVMIIYMTLSVVGIFFLRNYTCQHAGISPSSIGYCCAVCRMSMQGTQRVSRKGDKQEFQLLPVCLSKSFLTTCIELDFELLIITHSLESKRAEGGSIRVSLLMMLRCLLLCSYSASGVRLQLCKHPAM